MNFINTEVEEIKEPHWHTVRFDTQTSFVDSLRIIDDAVSHGFHFRIKDGVLEWTDDPIEHEFVHNLLTFNIFDIP